MSRPRALWRSPLPGPAPARVLWSAAALWVAPMLPGLGCLGAVMLVPGEPALALWAIGMALVFSPLLSWIGWVLALPAALWLVQRGGFGWGQAALVGSAAGALAGQVVDSPAALPFGILALLALRWLAFGPAPTQD